MDPSILAAMDKEALKKQIENMKYQASMERWPLSKSIAAWVIPISNNIAVVTSYSAQAHQPGSGPLCCALDEFSAFSQGHEVGNRLGRDG